MDKEQYLKEVKRIEEGIRAFQALRREMDAQYIEEHKRFNIGDKVRIVYDERTHLGRNIPKEERLAFVRSFSVSYYGDVDTHLLKCKNDGTPSLHSDHAQEAEIHPID